jgi:hypothetical protein
LNFLSSSPRREMPFFKSKHPFPYPRGILISSPRPEDYNSRFLDSVTTFQDWIAITFTNQSLILSSSPANLKLTPTNTVQVPPRYFRAKRGFRPLHWFTSEIWILWLCRWQILTATMLSGSGRCTLPYERSIVGCSVWILHCIPGMASEFLGPEPDWIPLRIGEEMIAMARDSDFAWGDWIPTRLHWQSRWKFLETRLSKRTKGEQFSLWFQLARLRLPPGKRL